MLFRSGRLAFRTVEKVEAYGGRVEILLGNTILQFNDGTILRFYDKNIPLPEKHQLLVQFDDETALVVTVAMYGGIMCYEKGAAENFYISVARERPSPLTSEFDYAYFSALLNDETLKMSAKAFLATKQRIPGLGNGVLQDILLNAGIHPKTKMNTLTEAQLKTMFSSVKETLQDMREKGGRDTEKDLFGNMGGYKTKLSKNNKLLVCKNCGGAVRKENYLGGAIYYCQQCQPKQ